MKKSILMMSVTFVLGIMINVNSAALAADLGLVKSLTSKLGVTDEQATGGSGAIFNMAKQNLSKSKFAQIAKAVPGIDKMMKAAPKTESDNGMLGSASSLIEKDAPALSKVASLTNSFSKLGMNADMLDKFTPVILDYVKSKGGDKTMKVLQAVLQ
ncbi:MAG: DUF2780 domain-containing protein [Deltaproteobacteria bacterium]